MTRQPPQAARELAGELARCFERDSELAKQLNDAHSRLLAANDRLWTGLHPEGLKALYGDHPRFDDTVQLEATLQSSSEVLSSTDPLGLIQDVHWQILAAHNDYQTVAEDRRQLAADVGELVRAFVDALTAAGWSERDARNANVLELAPEA